jgi:DNA repair exonuclease SbcCD ATPase subunit
MKDQIKLLQQELDRNKAKKELLSSQLEQEQIKLKKLTRRVRHAEEARDVIINVGRKTQEKLEFHISSLVSTALAAVFPDPYSFLLNFIHSRNNSSASMFLERNGKKYNPLQATGGGVVNITTLALRIGFWSLKKNRPVFILDEPTRDLYPHLQPKASQMFKMLSEKMKLQFIIVSHEDGLIEEADKVFRVEKGKVTELT